MLPSPLSLFFFFKHATKCYQVAFQRQSGKVPKSASLPINSRSHQTGTVHRAQINFDDCVSHWL